MASTAASAPAHPRLRRFFRVNQRTGWTSVALLGYGVPQVIGAPSPVWLAIAVGLMVLTLLLLVLVVVLALRTPELEGFWRRAPDGAQTLIFALVGLGILVRDLGSWLVVAAGISFALAVWGLVGVITRVVRWPVQLDEL